jgi:hypothetical protein
VVVVGNYTAYVVSNGIHRATRKKSHRPGKCHCKGGVERGGEGRGRERRVRFESEGWEGKEGHRESRPRIVPKW